MIRVARISRTSYVPAVWEGETSDGRPVYVRFNFGSLHVRVGEHGSNIKNVFVGRPSEMRYYPIGEPWDHVMKFDEMKEVTSRDYDWPESDD